MLYIAGPHADGWQPCMRLASVSVSDCQQADRTAGHKHGSCTAGNVRTGRQGQLRRTTDFGNGRERAMSASLSNSARMKGLLRTRNTPASTPAARMQTHGEARSLHGAEKRHPWRPSTSLKGAGCCTHAACAGGHAPLPSPCAMHAWCLCRQVRTTLSGTWMHAACACRHAPLPSPQACMQGACSGGRARRRPGPAYRVPDQADARRMRAPLAQPCSTESVAPTETQSLPNAGCLIRQMGTHRWPSP